MIEDAALVPSGSEISVDICIVGGGAAGITLALQLRGTGLRIMLVESGGPTPSPRAQALYAGEVVDSALHPPADRYRDRVFGGTTRTWGGRCIPYDPVDFEYRPWIAEQGWPIAYDEIARYYPQANALCEAGDFQYSAEAGADPMQAMMRGFDPEYFTCDPMERFSCPTNFADRYGAALAQDKDLRVLLGASCTAIHLSDNLRRVSSLTLRTLDRKQFTVTAGQVVLCTGGIETARLLLASRTQKPRGIGNDADMVGRHYMCHIAGTMGNVSFSAPADHIFHGYGRSWDGVYCRRRIALTAKAQALNEIGNIVFRLHHPRLSDPGHGTGILSLIYLAKPFISFEYQKRLHGSELTSLSAYLRHVGNVAREPLKTIAFLANWARKRTLAERKFPSLIVAPRSKVFSLDIHSEQAPNPLSRIMLSNAEDELGVPKVAIDWRYLPIDIRTVSSGLNLLKQELCAWGGATLDYAPEDVEHCMTRDGAFGGHHIGTARMSRSPQTGVVDINCRVHGTENLYVASSAVFPTSSQANPTLTIVALALRLAESLRSAGSAAAEISVEGGWA